MMGMINFWPEKKLNDFLSIKGSRHFPRVRCLSEQSYLTIKNYETHRTFRFNMSNLRNIQKSNEEIPIIDSKRISLMGLFFWDMRSHPKM
jgi:hypothetical protein